MTVTVGRIMKALSGFYYVKVDDTFIRCKGRGVFRNRGINPLVGDDVTIQLEGAYDDSVIIEIHNRKNELIRPPIANVDQALLVFSIVEPNMSLHLLDRFLVVIESAHIQPIICLTKEDLAEENQLEKIQSVSMYYKKIGYPIVQTYLNDPQLFTKLAPYIKEKTTVLAGQSGVGKSSLLNTIFPNLQLQTGEISEALGRGKHTTRHVELIEVANGFVADTPGFSSLELQHIERDELRNYFIEMKKVAVDCKFRGCLHVKEPSCAVKEAVQTGTIAQHRYDHYLQFLQEITDRKPRYSK